MTDVVTENTVRQAPKRRLPDFGRRNEKIVAGGSGEFGQATAGGDRIAVSCSHGAGADAARGD